MSISGGIKHVKYWRIYNKEAVEWMADADLLQETYRSPFCRKSE